MARRSRREDADEAELPELELRIVGRRAAADAAAAAVRALGIVVRGPYSRRRERSRVAYYAEVPAGTPMPAELTAGSVPAGDLESGAT